MRLDQDEKRLQESYENEQWVEVSDKNELDKYQKYAEDTFRKNKRINIRLSAKDYYDIQKKALEEGIPYQTLISSIIHKYVSNRLVEKG